MACWKVMTALTAVATLATTVGAQNPEDLKKDLDALKRQVAAQSNLIEDQARRLSAFEKEREAGTREAAVETEVNRLTERLAAGTTVRSAAERLTFAGEFRFRTYWEFGDNAAGVERDGTWTSSKIRFGILYEFTKNVAAYLDLQSTFAFGHNGHSTAAPPTLNFDPGEPIHACQAWLEVGNLFDRKEFSTKVGRQSVTLGNQFQFGNADWYQGYFFDGARYDWNDESWSLAAMWLRTTTLSGNDANQAPGYGPWNPSGPVGSGRDGHDNDDFWVVYFTLKSIKDCTLDLYWIYANQNAGGTFNGSGPFSPAGGTTAGVSGLPAGTLAPAYYHTFGARFAGMADLADGFDWNVEAAYQTGTLDLVPGDVDVDGFSVEGELGLTFSKADKLRVWIRGLFAEGPSNNDTGYLPIAPNRHSNTAPFRARYGVMDVIPMSDVFALTGGVHFDPAADWTFGLTGVWGERDSNQPAGVDESYGFEIDAWGEYRYSESLTFSGGVSFLFPDDQLDGAVAGPITFDDDTQILLWAQARLFF